ncbi:MAG: putative Sulfur carrier protein TtuB [Methanothrix sp.]|jgi:sulfur carrier protein|nr:MAG: putative Sulfur carrier protein TtuB [Methanothrix sp.]
MRVILPDGETRVMSSGGPLIRDLLEELGINPLEVLVARNGRIVPEEDLAGEEDEIRVIRVVHGG